MPRNIACDTYLENSIKSRERAGESYFLRGPDMKVPADFITFLKNGDNKMMFFNLMQQSIENGRYSLNDRIIYFSNATQCKNVTKDEARIFPELQSNHKGANI